MPKDKLEPGRATEEVIFGEREVAPGIVMGLILLNRPAQINAVSASMFAAINDQLDRWEYEERVVAIGLAGAGERGFCAGGDVLSLYHLSQEPDDKEALIDAESFFDSEYRADARLHGWAKPVVTFAHGICMGGGLGLARSGSHRVITADVRIAMPEVHIGFFPDVGSCAFLQDLPSGLGRLMATTGISINAADALQSGLVTALAGEAERATFWDQIADLDWTVDASHNHICLTEFLQSMTEKAAGSLDAPGALADRPALAKLAEAPDFAALAAALGRLAHTNDFLRSASAALPTASPGSMLLADRYFQRSAGRELAEVLESDGTLAKRRIREPDFSEGVRAVLVDKSGAARWSPQSIVDVSEEYIDGLLDGI